MSGKWKREKIVCECCKREISKSSMTMHLRWNEDCAKFYDSKESKVSTQKKDENTCTIYDVADVMRFIQESYDFWKKLVTAVGGKL